MGKKLSVEEAMEIYLTTNSYYLKRDMKKFLKKKKVKIPESS